MIYSFDDESETNSRAARQIILMQLLGWESMHKLLVADDDEMIRSCVAACLKAVGYEVIEAQDGLDALGKYYSLGDGISLSIIDVSMPNLNGIDVAKRIREIDPTARVILMNGFPEKSVEEIKPDAFLLKPFRGKELYQVIRHVLVEYEPPNMLTR